MGSASAYGVGGVHQHTPELVQDLSEAAGEPVTLSFTPVLAPMPRGILATATARSADATTDAVRGGLRRGLRRRAVRHCPASGAWPHTVGHGRCELGPPSGRRRTRSGRWSSSPPSTTSTRGRRAPAAAVAEPRPRLPGVTGVGLTRSRGRAVSVTAAGVPRLGVAAGLKSTGATRRRARRQRRPVAAAAGSSPATGCRPIRCCGASRRWPRRACGRWC